MNDRRATHPVGDWMRLRVGAQFDMRVVAKLVEKGGRREGSLVKGAYHVNNDVMDDYRRLLVRDQLCTGSRARAIRADLVPRGLGLSAHHHHSGPALPAAEERGDTRHPETVASLRWCARVRRAHRLGHSRGWRVAGRRGGVTHSIKSQYFFSFVGKKLFMNPDDK